MKSNSTLSESVNVTFETVVGWRWFPMRKFSPYGCSVSLIGASISTKLQRTPLTIPMNINSFGWHIPPHNTYEYKPMALADIYPSSDNTINESNRNQNPMKKNYPDHTNNNSNNNTELGNSSHVKWSPDKWKPPLFPPHPQTSTPSIRPSAVAVCLGEEGVETLRARGNKHPRQPRHPTNYKGLIEEIKGAILTRYFIHRKKKTVVLKANSAHQHMHSYPSLHCIARIDKNTQRIGRNDQTSANATEEDHVTEYTRLIPNTQKNLHLRTNPRAKGPK